MITLAELAEIRERMKSVIRMRHDSAEDTRIVVSMGDCGIESGARDVLLAFVKEVSDRELDGVMVTQSDCVGLCEYEPVAEVYVPGKEKVTYIKMTAEKAAKVVGEHIVNGSPVAEYTIGGVK